MRVAANTFADIVTCILVDASTLRYVGFRLFGLNPVGDPPFPERARRVRYAR